MLRNLLVYSMYLYNNASQKRLAKFTLIKYCINFRNYGTQYALFNVRNNSCIPQYITYMYNNTLLHMYIIIILSLELGVIGGLITPVHSLMLRKSLHVYQVRLNWFLLLDSTQPAELPQ